MQLPQYSLCICTDLYLKADEQKPHVENLCFVWPPFSDASPFSFPPTSFLQSQDARKKLGTQTYRTLAAPWTQMSGDWVCDHPTHWEGLGSCCPQCCCRTCSPGHRCSCGSRWRTSATSFSSRVMAPASSACCFLSADPCLRRCRGHPPLQW